MHHYTFSFSVSFKQQQESNSTEYKNEHCFLFLEKLALCNAL